MSGQGERDNLIGSPHGVLVSIFPTFFARGESDELVNYKPTRRLASIYVILNIRHREVSGETSLCLTIDNNLLISMV